MVEQILQDFAKSYDLKFMVLRYFNAAGVDVAEQLYERHNPETHLIPLVLQVAAGQRQAITIYGKDYPTVDGTCIRDYVHVVDLCEAHLMALKALWAGSESNIYNLGTGQGYSVKQVVDAARAVTACDIPVVYGQRRAGDPAILVADATRAISELAWQPKYSDLKVILRHVWATCMPAEAGIHVPK